MNVTPLQRESGRLDTVGTFSGGHPKLGCGVPAALPNQQLHRPVVDIARKTVETDSNGAVLLLLALVELRSAQSHDSVVGPAGFEQGRDSSGKTAKSPAGGAESGALDARNAPLDPELAAVVGAWPELPERVKASILALVRAAE